MDTDKHGYSLIAGKPNRDTRSFPSTLDIRYWIFDIFFTIHQSFSVTLSLRHFVSIFECRMSNTRVPISK